MTLFSLDLFVFLDCYCRNYHVLSFHFYVLVFPFCFGCFCLDSNFHFYVLVFSFCFSCFCLDSKLYVIYPRGHASVELELFVPSK